MEYLNCLDISELFEFLEIEPRSDNFKMVQKILASRAEKESVAMEIKFKEFKDYKEICHTLEEKVTHLEQLGRSRNEELVQIKTENIDLKYEKQRADDEIQAQKVRLKEMEKMMEHIIELEKKLEMHKTNSSELCAALEEEKKKGIALEDKIVEFEGCKKICEALKVKVAYLEENCKNVSGREKKAIRNITSLWVDVEKFFCSKNNELVELETKNRYLEYVKQQSYDEIKFEKKRCKVLEEMAEHTVKNLELYKAHCSRLCTALEEERRKSVAVSGNLEELNRYKINCENLKEKVIHLEEDCRNVCEKEKNAKRTIINMSADLKNLTRSRNEELGMLNTKNKDLEILKRKSDDEVETQKNRYNELEIMVEHKADLEKDMEMYRDKCSKLVMALETMKKKSKAFESKLESNNELKEKVARLEEECRCVGEREKMAIQYLCKLINDPGNLRRIRGEEPIVLKTKNKMLECAKRKAEDEITSRKKRYESRVSRKDNIEVETDVSNIQSNKDESRRIKSKTNGGANDTSLSKLKTLSHKCGAKDHGSSGAASNRHSTVKVSDGGQFGAPKRPSCSHCQQVGHFRRDCPTVEGQEPRCGAREPRAGCRGRGRGEGQIEALPPTPPVLLASPVKMNAPVPQVQRVFSTQPGDLEGSATSSPKSPSTTEEGFESYLLEEVGEEVSWHNKYYGQGEELWR